MLSGVRLPAGGHTLVVPVLLVCPPAAATLLWSRAALVFHQTSLARMVVGSGGATCRVACPALGQLLRDKQPGMGPQNP